MSVRKPTSEAARETMQYGSDFPLGSDARTPSALFTVQDRVGICDGGMEQRHKGCVCKWNGMETDRS